MDGERPPRAPRWDASHREYACADATVVVCGPRTQMARGAAVQRNGLLARKNGPPALVVAGVRMSRDASEIVFGSQAKTWTSPRTARTVAKKAFMDRCALRSVRLNDGLTRLGKQAFEGCEGLRRVLLGAGLREIGYMCFYRSGLEEVVLPGSVRLVDEAIFCCCAGLKRVVFAGEGP